MNQLGRHIVVEFYDCPAEILSDVSHIEAAMLQAARDAQATIINSTFHHFSPFGVSGVVVIQESHLAIHSYPEYGYAAIDVFTCGEQVDPWVCYNSLFASLQAGHGSALEIGRGQKQLLRPAPEDEIRDQYQDASAVQAVHSRNIWFTERDDDIALSLRHTGEVLFRGQSPYQKVEVFETYAYGKLLVLDGKVMTTDQDEYVYHEMITHPALLTHPNPRRVLVIGGGDGGAVREILRHSSVEQVVMVEIDQMVIDASIEHLPQIACEFQNPRLELRVEDGIAYVEAAPDQSFDVVLIDSTDPIGPAEGLFSETFYREVYRLLTSQGLMIVQSESPRFNVKVFQEIYGCFRGIFGASEVHCFLIAVPTYPSGTWSLAYCSKGGVHPLRDFDPERARAFSEAHDLKYYNEGIHQAAFALPNYVRKLLEA
jgi:spermidine synthase